jgi:HEAT repeat protein
MTSTIPDKDVPLYLGRTLDQWWVDFLSANYVDDMKPACQELMGLAPLDVLWNYREAHRLADANTNLIYQALPCFGDAFVRKVVEMLPGLDEQRRSRAVFAIAKTGWPSVPCLVQLLEHPSPNVRAAACLGLAEVAGSIERDEPAAVRKWKTDFLCGPRLSREEVESFFDTMEELYDSTDVKNPVDSGVPSALIKRLEDAYETVRLAAVAALKLLFNLCQVELSASGKLFAALKAGLEDECQAVRLSAMAALDFLELGKSPVGEQKPRLYDLLADPSTEEMAVRELAYNPVVEHLQRLLNDPSTDVRERVGRILTLCGTGQDVTNLGRRDILNLVGALQDADPVGGHDSVSRQEAIWALQWLADQWEDAKPNQLDENELESQQLHPPVLKSLSMHRHQLIQASLERLVAALHDPDIAIRSAAVDALAENRNASPKAVEYVDKMLQDPCKQVRWRAERALNILVRDRSEAWERYGLDGPPVANRY